MIELNEDTLMLGVSLAGLASFLYINHLGKKHTQKVFDSKFGSKNHLEEIYSCVSAIPTLASRIVSKAEIYLLNSVAPKEYKFSRKELGALLGGQDGK